MATIDSNGVLFYQDSDNFTPPASLNLAQSNLSNLLAAGVRFKRVANTTARSALVTSIGLANITPDNPLLVWRADAATGLQLEYTTNGTTWAASLTDSYMPDTSQPTMNGFVGHFEAGWGGLTIRREGRLVIINGLVVNGASWSQGAVCGVVAAELRPPRREGGIGAEVLANGAIEMNSPGAAGAKVPIKIAYFLPR